MIVDMVAYKKTYYQQHRERLLSYQREYSYINKIRLKIKSGEECTNEEMETLYEYDKKKLKKKLKIKRYESKISIRTGFISVKFD